jgi:sec-independent protein translocase protein TatA
MLGGFHWWDLLPLALIALLIWGPKRLPEMGSSIGKTIKEFQKSMREVKEPDAPPTAAVPPATAPATPELPSAASLSTTTEAPKE